MKFQQYPIENSPIHRLTLVLFSLVPNGDNNRWDFKKPPLQCPGVCDVEVCGRNGTLYLGDYLEKDALNMSRLSGKGAAPQKPDSRNRKQHCSGLPRLTDVGFQFLIHISCVTLDTSLHYSELQYT